MSGNNCNRFFSETHSTSPSLPHIEDLSNSLQNIFLSDLGFVENSQTGDEGKRGSIGVHSTFFLGNQSSGNSIESTWNPASERGRAPQGEGWDVQQRDIGRAYSVQDLMNGDGDTGSLYPPNLISLCDDQGVGPSTGYRISQLELMGDQERGIWGTGSVLNLGLGSETWRIQRRQDYHWGLTGWTGRDDTSNESFMPNFRPDSRISYNGYNGSNSIRGMQSLNHLTGGLYLQGAQPTRTPSSEEYSDAGNTAPSCEWTDQPLPEAVHLNNFMLHAGDLSLPEGLNCGDIQAIATNPIGCRYLLQILSGREPFAIQKILVEILEVVFEVMSDHIGNHLFQKLLESCDDNQIETIVARVTECENSLADVANTKSGTRSVQKLVKIVKRCSCAPLIRRITLALIPRIQALMTSPYGCHVIHCLSQTQGCHYPLLYNAIVENCLAVATDEKGCVTLNFCINNSRSSFREKLLNIISDNSVFLSQDPYGNYVVQHVLALEVPNITHKIWHKLSGNYERLSRQKNGSHVVEKCLWSSKRDCVIWELVNNEKFDQLARDQYGNYVIQTALITSEGELRNMLVEKIMKHARSLRCHPYGRNVINSLCSSLFTSSSGWL